MSNDQGKNQLLNLLAEAGPGSAVKALLTLRNISQTELSTKLGIAPSEISRVITGKRKTPRIRKAIAAELGIPVEVLFDGMDEQKREEDEKSSVYGEQPPNLFKASSVG